MFKQIKFVSIPVRDQDRALEFWTQKSEGNLFNVSEG